MVFYYEPLMSNFMSQMIRDQSRFYLLFFLREGDYQTEGNQMKLASVDKKKIDYFHIESDKV